MAALLDVLAMLPFDVVKQNCGWPVPNFFRILRTTCRQGRVLGNSGITSDRFSYPTGTNQLHDIVDGETAEDDWHQQLQQRGQYWKHLPHLSSVTLVNWPRQDHLNAALAMLESAMLESATGGRVTELYLDGCELSELIIATAAAAFPRLQSLRLGSQLQRDGSLDVHALVGPAFALLHAECKLTSLKVYHVVFSSDLMQSLCGVTSLMTLELYDVKLSGSDMCFMAGLSHLQHLCIANLERDDDDHGYIEIEQFSFAFAAPVFTLTKLIDLELQCVEYDGQRADLATKQAVQAAALLLGGCQNLESLKLGVRSAAQPMLVHDIIFSGLKHLTRLTELGVQGMRLSSPCPSGQLPLLETLELSHCQTPSELLGSLTPLLPLQTLRSLVMCFSISSEVSLWLGGPPGEFNDVEERVALRSLAQLLAAAPCLRVPDLHLWNEPGPLEGNYVMLPLHAVADDLHAALGRFEYVAVCDMQVTMVDAAHLFASMPGLVTLMVHRCKLHASVLGLAAMLLPKLKRLRVTLPDEGVRDKVWLALAFSSVRALDVEVTGGPGVDAEWSNCLTASRQSRSVCAVQQRSLGAT